MKFSEIHTVLKDNTSVAIREVRMNDAEQLLIMLKKSVKTSDHLLLSDGEINLTLQEEEVWVRNMIENPKCLLLVAVINGQIVGNSEIRIGQYRKTKHIGTLGMTIIEEWRDKGLGTILMNLLIEWARQYGSLEILELDVFGNNEAGIALYKKCGFTEKARLKSYFKTSDHKYADKVIMTLNLEK